MGLLPSVITQPVSRLGAAAQNALEVARFGGLETGEERSPFEVVGEHRVYNLRHYFPAPTAGDAERLPVLLVPPLMLAADVYDVSPAATAVGTLYEHGTDPWVVDFGAPERQAGGLERTLADHVVAVSDAVDRVREATGRDVHLAGYSQGGMFCYQTAAYRRSEGLDSVITFGSPVDTRAAVPFGIPEQLATRGADVLSDVLRGWALPAWASRTGFRLMDPVKSLRSRLSFVRQLHDRDALLPRERQRRFLEGEGWVAWPGPAMADFLVQFIAHNRMLEGGFVIEERLVTLADIECPILSFVGEVDEIAPAAGVRAIDHAAPRADVYEVALRAGHFGLVVGSAATRTTWPVVAEWARWRAGEGELPESVVQVEHDVEEEEEAADADRARYNLELAAGVGAGIVRSLGDTASRTVRSVRELTREALAQLPRLARLEQIQPSTRISLGLLLDEQASRAPEDVCFLFEDRAHTQTAVKGRIDNLVRGLISVGVRQGEHVGVLMGTRPTALAVLAALSRLGAVAIMLRPDGDVSREAELAQVARIIADPEHAKLAAERGKVDTFVLGGGGGPRDLGLPVFDMEQIDPDAVELPAWYRPNPGRASDLAFILFTGEGDGIRMSRITNRRWAVSAFGTATSAALSPNDTVYSVTPLYHPSGLLMTIGGSLAGGARLAMATAFDPATFWDEARRYGVTVTSYTWALLHDLAEAPSNPAERHHAVRLFIGSGMPRGLWRRVEERFAPARVLEFYASTEVDAILVNVAGAKRGSMGRPLPGSAEVRIARFDPERKRLIEGPDGLAQECDVNDVGMLLARVGPGTRSSATPLRGVFSPDDAWVMTGDLFRRDREGDHWRVDAASALIRTASGLVAAGPSRDALAELPLVDLAVSYGVPVGDEVEVAVVAVTLREGRSLHATDIDAALRNITPAERPAVVHVVDEIPLTTWYRPRTGPLRAAGIPPIDSDHPAWYRDADGYYERATEAARRSLAAA